MLGPVFSTCFPDHREMGISHWSRKVMRPLTTVDRRQVEMDFAQHLSADQMVQRIHSTRFSEHPGGTTRGAVMLEKHEVFSFPDE